MNPKRRALEDAWRERVQIALTGLRLAAMKSRLLQAERENGLMSGPNGSFAYRQAPQSEKLALAEYQRVLRVFADLTVRGKIPEPDQS
jgi:hypothetical protein